MSFHGFVSTVAAMLLAALCISLRAGETVRHVNKTALPDGKVVVVAEGDFEPRSIGSYSVRLYTGESKRFPTDDFACGLIRERDGAIESVKLADVDGDKVAEVVVIIRCAGTGGYLSADAFRVRSGVLALAAHVEDLPKDADVFRALSAAFSRKGKSTPPPIGTQAWRREVERRTGVVDRDGHGPNTGSVEWLKAVSRKVAVYDDQGHGPDLGSGEWKSCVHRKVFGVEP